MPIFVKHGGSYYKIADDILAKSVVPKQRFETRLHRLENEIAEAAAGKGLTHYQLIEFSDEDFEGL